MSDRGNTVHYWRLFQISCLHSFNNAGDEYGYVILSTVRSQPLKEIRHKHYVQPDRSWMNENLGFITDRHQINVGITRSKYGLVITGWLSQGCMYLVVTSFAELRGPDYFPERNGMIRTVPWSYSTERNGIINLLLKL